MALGLDGDMRLSCRLVVEYTNNCEKGLILSSLKRERRYSFSELKLSLISPFSIFFTNLENGSRGV